MIAALVMCQKVGDLLVPWFGGRVIDAMAQGRPLPAVAVLILSAFTLWVLHGNVLPYVLGRYDTVRFQFVARQRISVDVIRAVLGNPAAQRGGKDSALQQAVVERGEQVLIDFINSLVRVAIPVTLPGIVTLAVLFAWFPMLGVIAIVGGLLDMLVTLHLNKVLAPLYGRFQQLDYQRQRLHTRIFRDLAAIFAGRREAATTAAYDQRWSDYAACGITANLRYLGFNFGRGFIVNITNLCTWLVGAWYVHTGVYSLGFFLASLSWSTYVLNVLGAATALQKQWLETMPAIRAFFAEIDALAVPAIAIVERAATRPRLVPPAGPAAVTLDDTEAEPAVVLELT
ncbi:MAG TPA: hypothetical protein VFA50_11950 [Stellaceae bacterium]|nr:hypothetical protein [Stellaceae bacterium]